MDDQTARMKSIDDEFDLIFFGCRCGQEPAPVTLMRAATKMIVASYPESRDKDLAVTSLISGAKHLRAAWGNYGA
jgi:hypothetical protein